MDSSCEQARIQRGKLQGDYYEEENILAKFVNKMRLNSIMKNFIC
jgi:hypothetical protein